MSTAESSPQAPRGQGVRLVVSWLIVSIPIIYALVQTIRTIIPLFSG